VIIEKNHYELRIFDGEVILTDPQSFADDYAEVYFHDTIEQARADLMSGVEKALHAGWKLYSRK